MLTPFAFVALYFPHQEDSVDNHAADEQQEEWNSQQQLGQAAPVDDDPGDIERDHQRDQPSPSIGEVAVAKTISSLE